MSRVNFSKYTQNGPSILASASLVSGEISEEICFKKWVKLIEKARIFEQDLIKREDEFSKYEGQDEDETIVENLINPFAEDEIEKMTFPLSRRAEVMTRWEDFMDILSRYQETLKTQAKVKDNLRKEYMKIVNQSELVECFS